MIRAAALALALLACGGGGDRAAPAGAQLGAALAAALEAAGRLEAPWRCAAPDGPTLTAATLELDGRTWKLDGHALRREGRPAGRPLVIGAIADAGGAAPPTIAGLGRLRTQLSRAEVVLALGGMGATQPELEATLGTLAERAPYPLVALPGDLEAAPALAAAVAALRARGLHVLDGRRVHTVELPGATIALVPGAGAVGRLVAGTAGCAYQPADVARAYAALTPRPGLRIVATAEAPRVMAGGDPAGELALTPAAEHEIDLIVHGPVTEDATRARTGGRSADAVAVTPGTADATARLPGPQHAPTAGLVTINGTSWSWKPIADTD